MVTKKELQEQIAALQKQVEGLEDEEQTDYVLNMATRSGWCLVIEHPFPFGISERTNKVSKIDDKPHGLGVYRSKEYAEMARACLIHLLHELKLREDRLSFVELVTKDRNMSIEFDVNPSKGLKLIAEMEQADAATQGGCDE